MWSSIIHSILHFNLLRSRFSSNFNVYIVCILLVLNCEVNNTMFEIFYLELILHVSSFYIFLLHASPISEIIHEIIKKIPKMILKHRKLTFARKKLLQKSFMGEKEKENLSPSFLFFIIYMYLYLCDYISSSNKQNMDIKIHIWLFCIF